MLTRFLFLKDIEEAMLVMLVAFLEIALGEKMESEEEEEDWASFSLVCTIFYHIISAVRCTLVPRSKIENPESLFFMRQKTDFLTQIAILLQIQREEEATLMKILLVTMAKRQWLRWKVDEQIYLVTLKLNRRMTASISYSGIAKTPALLSTGLW